MLPLTLAGPSSQTLPTLSPFPSKLYRKCSPFQRYNTALGFSQTQRISKNGISGSGLGYFRRQALIVQDKCYFCLLLTLKIKVSYFTSKKEFIQKQQMIAIQDKQAITQTIGKSDKERNFMEKEVGRGIEQKCIGKMMVSHWLNCWSS